MAADEDQPKATKPGGERRSGGDRRQRPPVTIDLKAEKVADKSGAERPAASPKAPREAATGEAAAESTSPKVGTPHKPDTAPDRTQRWAPIVLAGATGGAIALILVIVLQATGLLPVPGGSAANRAIEQAETAANAAFALDRRVIALEAMTEDLPSMRSDIEELAAKLSVLEGRARILAAGSDVEAVKAELDGLIARLNAAPPPVTRQDLAGLSSRVGRLEAVPPARDGSDSGGAAAIALAGRIRNSEMDLASLAARVDAVEEEIATLSATESAASDGEIAARAIALVSLRRAVEGGEPFAADLDLITVLGFAGKEIAELRRFAKDGVETRAALTAQFPAVADAILAATIRSDPDAGFFRQLVVGVGGLVSVRPSEPVAGDDPPAIVSRMRAAVAEGDFAVAVVERGGLPAAGIDASADWTARAVDRVTVERLVEAIAGAPGDPAGE